MGYWGWRPLILLICISVWVTGCNISSEHAATIPPTELPPITLTVRLREPTIPPPSPLAPLTTTELPAATQIASAGLEAYIVRPGDTLLGIALDFDVNVNLLRDYNPNVNPRGLQVGQQILVPTGITPTATLRALVPLALDTPTCSVTLVSSVLCMGRIVNTQTYTVGNIRIRMQLISTDADERILDERYTSINQMLLLPGEAAPFSVLFRNTNQQPYSRVAAILEAAVANPPLQNQLIALIVEAEANQFINGHFEFSAVLVNPSAQTTAPVGLTLTLLDVDQRVIGYRYVMTESGLTPGERLPVALQIMPQFGQSPASYTFAYEALPAAGD